ncbi:MAG: hypothetical protein QW757_04495 [Candidatus Woesearchaeota archaeon]
MKEQVELLGLRGLGNIALLVLSIRGHLQQGHIEGALQYLGQNFNLLKQQYPDYKGLNLSSFEESFKPPYANITPYDILVSLSNNNVIPYSPETIFNEMQRQIDEVFSFVLKLVDYISNPDNYRGQRIKLVESDGKTPLFGLEDLLDYEITQPEQAKAFLTCFGWGLGKMDSFEHRFETGLPYGGGINVPLNLTNLPNGKKGLWHDTLTLTQIHLPEELGIEQPQKLDQLMEVFYLKILKPLQEIGLVQNEAIQGPNSMDGYVRILRGPGSADFMSYIFSWIIYGPYGWLGMRIADFWDTAEQISSKIVFGGQDNQAYKQLLQLPKFKEQMKSNKPLDLALSRWSFEDPNARFQPIESCSERYFLQGNKGDKGPYNTIITQYNFLRHLPEQFKTGTVDKKIPKFPIGFGRASSRGYFDYVIQRLHEFYEEGLIPSWTYFAQNLQY